MAIEVLRIPMSRDGDEEFLIDAAPEYERLAFAFQRTIRVIHGLPRLHTGASPLLDQFEVRIGRAVRDTVLGRLKSAYREHGHRYGTVLFRCSSAEVGHMEAAAIRVLKRLKDRQKLCVREANVAEDSRGGVSSARIAYVYMTWDHDDDWSAYEKPRVEDIREVAALVAEAGKHAIDASTIASGLAPLRAPASDYEDLVFARTD